MTSQPDVRPLLSWLGVDYSAPLPWANIPCRACGERELAKHASNSTTDFVCMACGDIQKIEAGRTVAHADNETKARRLVEDPDAYFAECRAARQAEARQSVRDFPSTAAAALARQNKHVRDLQALIGHLGKVVDALRTQTAEPTPLDLMNHEHPPQLPDAVDEARAQVIRSLELLSELRGQLEGLEFKS
jgi:hypothetical protein